MGRPPISVLVPTLNEESSLPDCLASVRWADEIVVVDSHSTDRTREVAAACGARVLVRAFDDYATQKNWALGELTHDWVLWLDADERADAALQQAVAALGPEPAADAYRIARVNHFLGRRIDHCGWQGERVARLFRRAGSRFEGAIHERLVGPARWADLGGALSHHPYRTWDDCLAKLERYGRATARKAYDAGRRAGPLDVAVRPPLRFLRMYLLQGGMLDGAHGLVLCGLAACQVFVKYAMLWDASRRGLEAFARREGDG